MAGGAGSKEFGSMKNWVVALCTFGVVLILSNFTKGIFKLGSSESYNFNNDDSGRL